MSERYPIIAVTGSSGAGSSSVRSTFEQIFRREGIVGAYVEGEAFRRYNNEEMAARIALETSTGNFDFSDFSPEAALLSELETVFRTYSERGRGRTRHYVHDQCDAQQYERPLDTFTPWEEFPTGTDILFYEGLHGAVVHESINVARYADLKIGMVPVINLEWIQKIHRDRELRGASTEAVTDVILRRMPDYVRHICPQFNRTDINFQRVPTVDTSNPFSSRWVPTPDESMVVIRFRNPAGIDFAYLLAMIHDSFMSRANSIVIPGAKLDIAMQLILTPKIMRLYERRQRWL